MKDSGSTNTVDISEKAVARLAIAMQLNGRNDVHDMLLALLDAVGRSAPKPAPATNSVSVSSKSAQPSEPSDGAIYAAGSRPMPQDLAGHIADAGKMVAAQPSEPQAERPGSNPPPPAGPKPSPPPNPPEPAAEPLRGITPNQFEFLRNVMRTAIEAGITKEQFRRAAEIYFDSLDYLSQPPTKGESR